MSFAESYFHQTWQTFGPVVAFFSRLKRSSVDTVVGEDASRARRDFILEMMEAHPDAFQHEIDIQTMMNVYPSRF